MGKAGLTVGADGDVIESQAVVVSEEKESGRLIVPFEKMAVPGLLDGSRGSNRSPGGASSLHAGNDMEALQAWLRARAANRNTFSAYRKEAERFLLWCIVEHGTALSSIDTETASLYLRWLEQLGRVSPREWSERWRVPQSNWIGPRNLPREDPLWRPFNGPLSYASRRQAFTVVRLLFSFLTKVGYLRFNPFDQLSPKIPMLPGEGAPQQFADRTFTPQQWEEVLAFLGRMPEGVQKARLETILMMGKGLGMRTSEMLAARAGWITKRRLGNADVTMIEIIGKGDKVRRLPVQPEHIRTFNRYLGERGLEPIGMCDPQTRLLASLGHGPKNSTPNLELSRSGLYRLLKGFLEKVSAEAEERDPLDGAKLRAASTHWLRHTFASTALESMPVNVVQSALGHASLATTSLYLTPTEQKLAQEMKHLKPI